MTTMRRNLWRVFIAATVLLWAGFGGRFLTPSHAHDVPTSYATVRLGASGATVDLKIAWMGITHELPELGTSTTAAPDFIAAKKDVIARLITDRFGLATSENPLVAEVRDVIPTDDGKDIKFALYFPWKDKAGNDVPPPQTVKIYAELFPLAPLHRTLLSIYRGEALEGEAVLNWKEPTVEHKVGGAQGIGAVFGQFIKEGIHHIFIGPDHILFIIALMLAGGSLMQLLKIVTGFTVAHSITLVLATLNIVQLPSKFVEAVIALSIVFVGVSTLRRKEGSADRRLLFAFGFGLIHGFGFASVLQELDLPRYALGTSLFAFNIGVELGQACIVLIVAPLLALILKKSAVVHHRVVQLGAIAVSVAGAVWFIQRILPS
jgi:hydrogenase/urease accessory protein HupE